MNYPNLSTRFVFLKCVFLALGLFVCLHATVIAGPSITGLHAASPIYDIERCKPFSGVTVSDSGGADVTVTISISPSGYGNFVQVAGTELNSSSATILQCSPAQATTLMRSLEFVPELNKIPVGGSSTITFTVQATDTDGASSTPDSSVTLRIDGPERPMVSGAGSTSTKTDKETWKPFSSVTIRDNYPSAVTVTIVASPAGNGAFQAVSGLQVNGNTYTITPRTPAEAQTLIRSLVFDPEENHVPIGSNRDVRFTLWASDTNGLCSLTNNATVLTVVPVNDPPVLSGVTASSTTDKANLSPFSGVLVSDVDNDGTQTVTVNVVQSDSAKGTLLLNSSGFSGSGGNYSFTGTPANAQIAIRRLTFDPMENRVAPGQTESTTFSVTVTDASDDADSGSAVVSVMSVNDAPTLTGLSSVRQSVATGRSIAPFGGAVLTDPDASSETNRLGQSQTLTVSMTGAVGNGQLQFGGFSGTVFTQSGLTPVDVTTVLRNLLFAAQTHPLTTTNTVSFTVIVRDESGVSVTNSDVAVDVSTPFVPPGLSGTRSDQRVNDNSTIPLFSTINVQSFNAGFFQVILHLDDDAKGSLINLGGFVKSGVPASYVFTGTSEDATTYLREMLFQPVNNRLSGSSSEKAIFSITLVDGTVTNAPDSSTTVIVTPVNDIPAIQGISPLATITDDEHRAPFSTILVTDVDELAQQQLAVSVSLDDSAKGGFDPASLADSGFTASSGGYTFSGTPAAVSAALRKLVFVPTPRRLPVGLSDITTFNVSVNDNHGGQIVNSATQIRVAAVNGAPVVSVPAGPVSLPLAPPINPFSAVSFAAPQTISVTVKLADSSLGAFTAASLAENSFSNNAPGSWTFTGTASNATVSIAGLEFVPDSHLPIGTTITFLISAQDQAGNIGQASLVLALRQEQRSIIVTKTTDFDPGDSTVPASVRNGTLRQAVIDAGNNDHITFDIRSQIPGAPDYPAVIALRSTIVLNKNITFDGPGADLLTISGDTNGDGTPDVQIFEANARVVVNRLTLAKGYHPTAGGAIEVSPASSLSLRSCAIVDSQAGVWGGGIDVNLGSLEVDSCLIKDNRTSSTVGQGGGGISIYSFIPAQIANTTFSGNEQLSPAGLGGGALYAENADPGTEMIVDVVCCTFSENLDLAGHGSAIRPNVFNAIVRLQNTILADGQGKNLEMDESGMIISLGGNISDDATATVFSIGGDSFDTVILDHTTDVLMTNGALAALADNGGPTLTYALGSSSLALGMAVSNTVSAPSFHALATDQRGYIRDGDPDVGAFERGAGARVIIQEILCNPVSPNDEFIEFFLPHDSVALNLANYQVWVGGVLRHTFSPQELRPGEALVVFSRNAASTAVPTGVYKQIAAGNLSLDNNADAITLKNPAGQIVWEVNYVASFVCSDPADPGQLDVPNQSLVLSPQFQGVYLPYRRVVEKEGGRIPGPGELSGAGYNAAGRPLTLGNTPPVAYRDSAATDAATAMQIPVLSNDFDPDLTDVIRVVAVGANGSMGTNGLSTLGASLLISSSSQTGFSVTYSPSNSAFLRSLPKGSNVIDTFQYIIIDSSNGVDHVRGSTDDEIASNFAKATATVSVQVTGVNLPPEPVDDDIHSCVQLTVSEDAVLDFTTADTLLANDIDPNTDDDSNSLNIVSVQAANEVANTFQITTALGASVTLDIRFNRDQTHITYDPRNSGVLNAVPAGQSVEDTFYYSVVDRYGAVGTAAVRITVTGVNDAPLAEADNATTDEDTPITLNAATLMANDVDVDANANLYIASVSPTSLRGASVSLIAGNVRYDPTVSAELNTLARDEIGNDQFTYIVSDGLGGSSLTTVTISITGVNDTPSPANDFYSTGEKIPFSISGAGVLGNDTDADVNGTIPDDALRVLPFADKLSVAGARVSINPSGSFEYDPRGVFDWLAQGWTNDDTFTYTVMDHSLTVANADSFTVQSGTSSNLLSILANDACLSAAGGVLNITGLSTPSKGGQVVLADSSKVFYTPPQNFSGVETFSYTIADGLGGSDSAMVSVFVAGATLTINSDSFTVSKGQTVDLNVLANDRVQPAGAILAILSVGDGDKGGTIAVTGSGANSLVSYTPPNGIACPFTETFTYLASAAGQQATGIVYVTLVDRSHSLPANDDNFTVSGSGGTTALDVLANDRIIPGVNSNLVIVSIQTNGVMGTVSINATQDRLLYKPAPGVVQEPLIYYTVSDGAGGTAVANVLIRVQSNGLAANNDVFSVMKGSKDNTLSVLINDAVFPVANPVITNIGLGTNGPNHNGVVMINPSGTGLVYTPALDFAGEETFAYEIGDGTVARGQAFVRVKVIDPASVVSNPDSFAVGRDSTNNTLNVLRNDYVLPHFQGGLEVVALQTSGTRGSVELSSVGVNNTLSYTPPAAFIGRDTFHYVVRDTFGNVNTNVVEVVVGGLLTQPDRFSVLSDSAQNVLDVLANDYLVPDLGAIRAVGGVGIPDHGGLITTNADRTRILYTPAPGFVGTEQFSYQIADDAGELVSAIAQVKVFPAESDRKTATVTMTIIGTNDLPVIAGTRSWQMTDKETIQPFSNVDISDVDEHGLQVQNVTVTLDDYAKGAFVNLGGFSNSVPGAYVMQGKPSDVTAALRNMVFVPIENRITVPTDEITKVIISVDDGFVATPVTDSSTEINVTAVNDAPTITGSQSGFSIDDKSTVQPFPTMVIADVDDLELQPLQVTVTLDDPAKGTLSSLGPFTNSAPGVYAMCGVASNVTAAIRSLVFVPTQNRIVVPTSEITGFTIAVHDGYVSSAVSDSNTAVTVTATNDLPTIYGAAPASMNDRETIQPFAGVTIGEVDDLALQPLIVRVMLDDPVKGALQNLGAFTNSVPGVYTISGTAAEISAHLRALVYVPVENRIVVTTPEPATFTIEVDDHFGQTVINSDTVITVSAVNDLPVISGTFRGQRIYAGKTVAPFTRVSISDIDELGSQPITVIVTLDQPSHGYLTNFGGFAPKSPGIYELNDSTCALATAALRGLIFVPDIGRLAPGESQTTCFTIQVIDSGNGSIQDSNTTVTAIDSFIQKLTADNGSATNAFIYSVSTTRDMAVAGSPTDTGNYPHSGAAYLFTRTNIFPEQWSRAKKLISADNGTVFNQFDQFGYAVAINGETVVVGAPGAYQNSIQSGVIYLFGRDQGGSNRWGQVKKVVPPDGANNDLFGSAVALSGDTLVVGARGCKSVGVKTGAAYLFARNQGGSNQWGLVRRLSPADGAEGDDFGVSVSIENGTIAVGARYNRTNKLGSVYLYDRDSGGVNSWGLSGKITPLDLAANAGFGHSVGLGDGLLTVGVPYDVLNGVKCGSAYVFGRDQGGSNQWGQLKKLVAVDGSTNDAFGFSVSVDQGTVAVSAPRGSGGSATAAGVYVFAKQCAGIADWSLLQKIVTLPGDKCTYFGQAVSLRSETLVAGGRYLDAGSQSSLTYIYRLDFGDAPYVPQSKMIQEVTPGMPFTFTMPASTFQDTDTGDALSISLGSALPDWLTYDPLTSAFSGIPNYPGVYRITLVTTDAEGLTSSMQFGFSVAGVAIAVENSASRIVIFGTPGREYNVQRATSLLESQTVWQDVGSVTITQDGEAAFSETPTAASAFYRVIPR